MKHFFLFTALLFSQHVSAQDSLTGTLLDKRIPQWVKIPLEKSEVARNYMITDVINPFYLESDLTGDKLSDIVFLVESKQDGKKGVMIVNRGKNIVFVLGAGKDIGIGDNINGCETWFMYREKGLYDAFGNKKATLKYPAIQLVKSEKATIFIYWTGKKYKTHVQIFK